MIVSLSSINIIKSSPNFCNEAYKIVNRDTNSESLLQEVIKLNHGRILTRLRSRHARYYRPGSPIPLHRKLETAKTLLCRVKDTPSTSIRQLEKRIGILTSQMIEIENMGKAKAQSSACESYLLQLIKEIHEFMQFHKQDISRVPLDPGNWNKEATDSLRDRFLKLSRYIDSCEGLLRIARRNKAFTKISVEFINLQEWKSPISEPGNRGIIDRIISESCAKRSITRAAAYCRITEGTTRYKIRYRLSEEYKLHAEMQLVKFYEQIPSSHAPRVIWSTKRACYLCHTFFKTHGRYYLPNTHGKLYHAWHYPLQTTSSEGNERADCHVSNLTELSLEFSKVVDKELQDCLQYGAILRRSDCVESSVNRLAGLTPSVLSLQSQTINDRTNIATTVSEAKLLEGPISSDSNNACHADKDSASRSNIIDRIRTGEIQANTPHITVANTAKELTSTASPKKTSSVAHQYNVLEYHNIQRVASTAKDSTSKMSSNDSQIPINIKPKSYRPLKMHHGDTTSHIFPVYTNNDNDNNSSDSDDNENRILRIHTPDLHVNLQHFAMPAQMTKRRDSCMDDVYLPEENQQQQLQQYLHIEISCLGLASKVSKSLLAGNSTVFDFDDDDKDTSLPTTKEEQEEEEEQIHLPKDILYSMTGLLLKRKSTIFRLRAYIKILARI